MQATVHRFDPTTGSGALVTDAGVLLGFGPEALRGSGLRHLRTGQRLTVVPSDDGTRVVAFRLENVAVVPRTTRP